MEYYLTNPLSLPENNEGGCKDKKRILPDELRAGN
jgi:hypothetical protein